MVIIGILFSTIVFANVWTTTEVTTQQDPLVETLNEPAEIEGMWIPTKEDIAYQDSMYGIILNTQNDLTDIKQNIEHIFERLDYVDGTYDSIRYKKNGPIDKRRN